MGGPLGSLRLPPPLAGLVPPFAGPASAQLTPVGIPKTAALTDDFTAGAIDAAKWASFGGTVTFTGGTAQIVPVGAYPGLETLTYYDLTSSTLSAQFVQAPSASALNTTMEFGFFADRLGNGDLANGIQVLWYQSTLIFRLKTNSTNSDTSIAYDSTAHQYVQISEAGGTITWWTSPDGSTWTSRRTASTTFAPVSGKINLTAGTFGGDTGTGTAIFDNINLAPSIVSLSGSASVDTTATITAAGAVSTGAIGAPTVGTFTEDTAHASTSVPYPTVVNAGDFLLLWGSVNNLTAPTDPAGWTRQVFHSSTGDTVQPPTIYLATKYAAGTEGGTSLSVSHPSSVSAWQILAFSGVDQTTALDVALEFKDQTTSANNTTATGSTLVTAGDAAVYAAGLNSSVATSTPPTGFTETGDLVSGTRAFTVAYKLGFSTGASGSVGNTWSASARSVGVLVFLRPAATGGTFNGSATLASTATVTADGVVAVFGAGSVSTTATITAAGVVATSTSAPVSVTATVSAGSSATGTGNVATTATLTAAGLVATSTGAPVAVTATVTAAGVVAVFGSASRATTATITAAGGATSSGSVASTATITAAGLVAASTGATEAVTASLTAAGLTAVVGSATRATTATITAAGLVATSSTANVATTATVTAAGTMAAAGSATRATTATITADGVVATSTTAPVAVTATITAAGSVVSGTTGSGNRATTATLTAAGVVATSTTAPVATTATITAAGTVLAAFTGDGARTTTATITATGVVATASGAAQAVTVAVTVAGSIGQHGLANVAATVTVTAVGLVIDSATPTPAARTLIVHAETRTLTVAAEDRVLHVPTEGRTLHVPPESRTLAVPTQPRTLEVTLP